MIVIFKNQNGSWMHILIINIHEHLDWRITIFLPVGNCLYQPYTKSYQPKSDARLSSDTSFAIIKNVQKIGFTKNRRLHWNARSIQQIPIWINWKHYFQIIWWYQTSYETPWGNNDCFIDYSNAFGATDFYILIQKIFWLKFFRNVLYWILNYLMHRRHLDQHFVQIDSYYSSFLTAKYGVPQGSVLAPILDLSLWT